jgi:hypothetical protein
MAGLLSGCGGGNARATGPPRPIVLRALPLDRLYPVPPDCRGHGQTSEGSYPQLVGGAEFANANRRLAQAFAPLVHYSPVYREHLCFSAGDGPYAPLQSTRPEFIAASSSMISFMTYTFSNYWDGVMNVGLVSGTELLPSGQAVQLGSLFIRPQSGVRVLAVRIREQMAIDVVPLGTVADYMSAVRSTGQFALTTGGLVLGFTPILGNGNQTNIVVSYAVIGPYLSSLGRRLVAEVAQPDWAVPSPARLK